MLHSEQWHYSLHRDFQNCNSTQRSPTGFFSSNSTRVPIHHTTTYNLHTHASREFSIQNPILHAEDKNSSSTTTTSYRGQRNLHSRKRNSTHRRQGDLLEMHPCVLQDLPRTFQAFQPQDLPKALQLLQSFQRFQSFQTFLSSQTLQRHSSHS